MWLAAVTLRPFVDGHVGDYTTSTAKRIPANYATNGNVNWAALNTQIWAALTTVLKKGTVGVVVHLV